MRQHLNREGHDESCYLPKGVPPVNAYRASKGDIRRVGNEIQARHWMPDLLFDKDKLDQSEVNTCMMFYSILVAARRILGICDLRNVIVDKTIENAEKREEIDLFLLIMHQLPAPEANALLWVVCDEYNHGNLALAMHLIGTIRHAIEKAHKIIVDI